MDWNDIERRGGANPRDGEVMERCTWGDPVDEDRGDWIPVVEVPETIDGVTLDEVLRSFAREAVRWRVVAASPSPELQIWLPDIVAMVANR